MNIIKFQILLEPLTVLVANIPGRVHQITSAAPPRTVGPVSPIRTEASRAWPLGQLWLGCLHTAPPETAHSQSMFHTQVQECCILISSSEVCVCVNDICM